MTIVVTTNLHIALPEGLFCDYAAVPRKKQGSAETLETRKTFMDPERRPRTRLRGSVGSSALPLPAYAAVNTLYIRKLVKQSLKTVILR